MSACRNEVSDVLEAAAIEAKRWPLTMERLADSPANFESSKCRSGCPTQDHETWGECARAANLQTLVGDQVEANRRLEGNLAEYRKVRAQGIQPKSIRRTYVEAAKKASGA